MGANVKVLVFVLYRNIFMHMSNDCANSTILFHYCASRPI